jgi:cellulose synthase/poly-beta-1,6-N-acetylglucosamine synthase-like glycosyltransferase
MESTFPQLFLALYYLILGCLAFFGLHRLVLLVLYYRSERKGESTPAPPDHWPRVTVQLPLYNEMYVAARLIDSVCQVSYPQDKLEIQVLDDSTDETSEIVAASVARYRKLGFDIYHLHRKVRTGFKAGALEAGLRQAQGSLLAIFDADFVPPQDFLFKSVPHFCDARIGMVQARWDHINRDYSLLTQIQAIFLDGHFVIEHAARNRSGRFFNFNGTAGIWRRQAIEDAGGWEHDTLTEDLDLSYRAQLAGWNFLFLSDLKAPAELPVDINAFKRQQFRWAKGSIQVARKLLGRIFRAPIPWKVKAEAFIHLTNNASYLLMVVLSMAIFPAMILRRGTDVRILLLVDLPLFLGATVSVLLFYLCSQLALGNGWRRIRYLPALMGLGIGLAMNNAGAVVQGLFQNGGVFERTPKYRIESAHDAWKLKRYKVKRNISWWLEGLFAAFFAACFVLAWRWGLWLSLPFLYLFLQGYSYMFLLSFIGQTRIQRSKPLPRANLPTASSGASK